MDTNLNNPRMDDSRFDRLVDGELSEQERRELLAGLDNEPGGWRRCALTFLESQCWKHTLGALSKERVVGTLPTSLVRPARSRWPGRMQTVLAMAASFFLAFWVGSLVEQARFGFSVTPAGPSGQIASTAAPQIPTAPERSGQALAQVKPAKPAASTPWRTVTVSAPSGSSLRLPAVERDHLDSQWLRSLPPAVPNDVLQALNRTGHQIEQRRELVPIPLKDGRRLVVPVDQVDVHYVGNETY